MARRAGTNAVAAAEDDAKRKILEAVVASKEVGEGVAAFEVESPVKGFYYVLRQSEALSGILSATPGERLAGRDELSFPLTKWSESNFYQLLVRPVPADR